MRGFSRARGDGIHHIPGDGNMMALFARTLGAHVKESLTTAASSLDFFRMIHLKTLLEASMIKNRYKGLTHEQHIENADDLAVVAGYLKKITERCSGAYPQNHKINKALEKMDHLGLIGNVFSKLQSCLDTEYHAVTTDTQFNEKGHVYYHLDERFKNRRDQAA